MKAIATESRLTCQRLKTQPDAPCPALQTVSGRIAAALLAAATCTLLAVATEPATGLLAGAAIALLFDNPFEQATARAASLILKIAIVAMGAGMNLYAVLQTGAGGLLYTLTGVTLTLAAGLWIGRRFGLQADLSLLLATGTAICGGSAIAAMTGTIRAKPQDTSIALAVIFLLNAVALFVFPPLGRLIGLSPEQFGLWAALGIHDTSSVVGAASAYGGAALGIAITVKLARALWIVPLTVGVRLYRAKTGSGGEPLRAKHFMPPWFILGYLGMAAAFTWLPRQVTFQLAPLMDLIGHRAMAVALLLIGAGLTRKALQKAGLRPLAAALLLWLLVSVAYAALLKAGWIA